MKLIELAQRAHALCVAQPPKEQRRLVDVVLSNCTLNGRSLRFSLRKPFDLMLDVTEIEKWRAHAYEFGTAVLEMAA